MRAQQCCRMIFVGLLRCVVVRNLLSFIVRRTKPVTPQFCLNVYCIYTAPHRDHGLVAIDDAAGSDHDAADVIIWGGHICL
jgi:hypothetical protein